MTSKADIIDMSKKINSTPKLSVSLLAEKPKAASAPKGRPPKEKEEEKKENPSEDPLEKQRKINLRKLSDYQNSKIFGPICKELGIKECKGNESTDILEESLRRIRERHSSALRKKVVRTIFLNGVIGIEKLAVMFTEDPDYAGYAEALQKDPAMQDAFEADLEETAIENDFIPNPPPIVRLAITLADSMSNFSHQKKALRVKKTTTTTKETK